MHSSSRYLRGSAFAVLLAIPSGALGAQAAVAPPAMVFTACETVKPGMGVAHDQHEERWSRAIEATKGFAPALALQSMTGPAVTCWLTGVASYDALGKSFETLLADPAYARALPSLVGADAQYLSDLRTSVAKLRPDLSAGPMPNVLTRRVANWSVWNLRAGREAAFEAAVKAYAAAMTRAGVQPDFRVYQVLHGVTGAVFWTMGSTASMAALDTQMANDPKIAAAFTADDQKVFNELFTNALVSTTSNLWSYVSAQSALTPEQRATDPFWKRTGPAAAQRP